MNTRLKFADTYKAKYNRFRSKKLLAYQQLYHILVVIFYTPLARIFRLFSSIYVCKQAACAESVRSCGRVECVQLGRSRNNGNSSEKQEL